MLSCWNISRPSSPCAVNALIVRADARLVFAAVEMQCHVRFLCEVRWPKSAARNRVSRRCVVAAVAEEVLLVADRCRWPRSTTVARSLSRKARRQIGRQIEHRVMRPARDGVKKRALRRIVFEIAFGKFRSHLIGRLRDRRPDDRDDPRPPGAQRLHRRERRLGDPGQRALPARMRRADDARLLIGEQDRARNRR